MRGRDDKDVGLFSYLWLEERVPSGYPLRAIRALMDEVLKAMDARFDAVYSEVGHASIPPGHLLRATLFRRSFRSQRQRHS